MNQIATVVIDVVGGTISNFLDKSLYLPVQYHTELRKRIRYLNLAGQGGFVPSLPLLHRQRSTESLALTASRIVDLIRQTDKDFARASIYGLKRAEPLLTAVCKVLAALNLPISHADDLLLNPEGWVERMDEAVRRNPQAASGRQELLQYLSVPRKERELRSEPLRNRLHQIRHNEALRAMLASTRQPTIDWETVVTNSEIVLIDLSDPMDNAARELCLFTIWNSLLRYIKSRKNLGKLYPPLSVVIDELSFFVTSAQLNTDEIATQFSLLANNYMRNSNTLLTVATQYLDQLPPGMQATCQNFKTQLIGSLAADPDRAEAFAKRYGNMSPWAVKHWKPIYGSDNIRGKSTYYVIDREPIFLSLEEQNFLNSRPFRELQKGSWLVAASAEEGQAGDTLKSVSTRLLDRNQFDTQHADEIERMKSYLMRRDGVPIAEVLAEIEEQRIALLPPHPMPAVRRHRKEPKRTKAVPAVKPNGKKATTKPVPYVPAIQPNGKLTLTRKRSARDGD